MCVAHLHLPSVDIASVAVVVIPLGSRVKVFWTGERRWFFGVVDQSRREDGKRIHHVTYEDGDKKWHHLASESWLQVEDVEEPEEPGGEENMVDAKLWAGAASEGWSLKANADAHYVYFSPDGRRFSSRRAAEEVRHALARKRRRGADGKAARAAAKATTRAPRHGRSSGFVAASPYP